MCVLCVAYGSIFFLCFVPTVSAYCWVPTYKTFDNGNRLGWGFRFYQWLTRFVLLFIWLLISGIKVKTSSVSFVVSWLQVVIQVAGNKEFGRAVVSVYRSTLPTTVPGRFFSPRIPREVLRVHDIAICPDFQDGPQFHVGEGPRDIVNG